MDRLKGKLALVTGAAAGIGAAIARRFREEGAEVIVNDVSPDAAAALAGEVGGTALVADVSDSRAVAQMFGQVEHDFGRLEYGQQLEPGWSAQRPKPCRKLS